MRTNLKMIKGEDFNFELFLEDLSKELAARGQSMRYASEQVALRGYNYLSMACHKKIIHPHALMAVAKYYGLQPQKYEIKHEPPKPVVMPAQLGFWDVPQTGWANSLQVNLEAKVVTMIVFHDGQKVASGRAKIFDETDRGIVQAISYAAHMCYKIAEQKELIAQTREEGGNACKITSSTAARPASLR